MSDTPRTDAMLASVIESDYPAIVAHDFANFARQLERELAKAQKLHSDFLDQLEPRVQGICAEVDRLKTAQSATPASDVEQMKDALRALCYQPGEQPGFKSINYCRWCHYCEGHPHTQGCVMAVVDRTTKP